MNELCVFAAHLRFMLSIVRLSESTRPPSELTFAFVCFTAFSVCDCSEMFCICSILLNTITDLSCFSSMSYCCCACKIAS